MYLHDPARDLYISPSLISHGVFEPFQSELVLDEIRSGDTVVDLGANVGYYTLLFARRVGSRGRVFAFEPDPSNLSLLRRNIEANGYRNVVVCPLAVTDRCGLSQLFLSDDNTGDHRVYETVGRTAVNIETITLDRFFEGFRGQISLVKMDIQGAECAALFGMLAVLRQQLHLKLVTEFWPHGIRLGGFAPDRFLDVLQQEGFRFFEINEHHRALIRSERSKLLEIYSAEKGRFTNLWCVKSGRSRTPALQWVDTEEQARRAAAGDLRGLDVPTTLSSSEDRILEEILARIGLGESCLVSLQTFNHLWLERLRRTAERWRRVVVAVKSQGFEGSPPTVPQHCELRVFEDGLAVTGVEDFFEANGVPEEFDVLSIDLHGNEYWIWSAIRRWRPRVVAITYNAAHPPSRRWVMQQAPAERDWDGTTYFGASLASLTALGRAKNYTLVGTDGCGLRAFFVKAELASGRFLDTDVHYHYFPATYGPNNNGYPPGVGPFVEI